MKFRRMNLPLVLCALLATGGALAQSFPSKPIRYIIPFEAGGSSDVVGRYFNQDLAKELGQPIIVENRAGATGVIGLNYVASSPPDGYTLLQFSNTTAVAHYSQSKPFELDKVMTPIGNFNVGTAMLVVNPKILPVLSIPEMVKYVTANPGANYTSSGTGSPGHMMVEAMAKARGLNMTHIGYKGLGPALTDLLAGRVGMIVIGGVLARPHIQSGALRVIANASSSRAVYALDVPTAIEMGFPDLTNDSLTGIVGPPGMQGPVYDQLRAAVKKVTLSDNIQKYLTALGNVNKHIDGPEFRKVLIDDYQRWGRIIRESGIEIK